MTTTDPSPTPTADLLRIYQSGASEDALRQLILRYLPLVHATARRRTGSESLAADVAQTVLIDFARQARSMPVSVQIGGWLLRHTGFRASRALRTERRRAAREAEALRRSQLHPPAMTDDPADSSLLAEALHRLPAPEQSLLIMKFYESLEIPAIAGQLGISPTAAQKRMERALHRLRGLLAGSRGISRTAVIPRPLSSAVSLSALTLALESLLSRSVQAAAIPATLAREAAAAALAAARNRPLPALVVRFQHLGPAAGSLTGIAAALALCSVPFCFSLRGNSPDGPAVTLQSPAPPPGTVKQETEPDIDDVFEKLKALIDREGRNRLVWRKAEGLILSLPRGDYGEAVVRLDRMFSIQNTSPSSAGPDRWIMVLLYHWQPPSVPQALCALLPRLTPAVQDHAAMMLCRNWHRKSAPAAAAWLRTLLADHENKWLPEACRRTLVPQLAYPVMEDLLANHPEQARALGDQLEAGGFRNIRQAALRDLKASSAMAAREAILTPEHPWYLPVREVLDDRRTPAEKRALADKIGDPGVRQTLAGLLAERLFHARPPETSGSSPETRQTADWLLDQTLPARRAQVLGSIARAWVAGDPVGAESWFAARAPDATAILDQEKSRLARSPGAPEDSLARALSIRDPDLRDYTLAARLAAENDGPSDSPSILNSPALPAATASALRHWLAISP
ncbi:MAG: sigma-70 family RNA polymerase sigma factor [Verrucomicrobiota bacterium]